MAISFSLSELVALSVESFFFGIYFTLFGSTVKVLLNKRKTIPGAVSLLGLAGLFGVLISWHVVTDAIRLVYAFKSSQKPIGADFYYANVSSSLSLIKTSLYLIVTILFDAFILHRCWIVWERSFLVILLPLLIFLADIGTGIASVQGLSGLTRGDSVFLAKQEKITKSFFSSTVAVNGLCTCSIDRLSVWIRQNTIRNSRKAFGLTKEAAIIAESGAIYSITLILIIATYTTRSNSFNVFLDIFSLIVFRMGVTATEATHISMEGMGEAIPEENRSISGSMVKESRPQSEAHVGV
ncbi:hypothetical protein B0F90DRAFT_1731090 [Multifurca ochricompacta]|uniref:Uncharacterized protein n=1 Tax=Multifurca ochricompacta TaxID=376703 RepID=A0AAD4M1N5_9AGAM|nr:hypothetical protein B0F90DRAFT_1731090 [Multifurca ochricompacta]